MKRKVGFSLTLLTQALRDYIAYRSKSISPLYLRTAKCAITHFITSTHAKQVEQLTPYDINRWAELVGTKRYSNSAHQRSDIRGFLRWCRTRYYAHTPQLDVEGGGPRRHPHVLREQAAQRVAEWQRRAAVAAEALKLPHQRVIFLLGYLYGYSLSDLQTFGAKDLHELGPEMRRDLYDLFAALGPHLGPPSTLFRPWLGKARDTASSVWRRWVADTSVKFRDVVHAGAADRLLAGMAPRCDKHTADAIVAAFPSVSRAGMDRMKRWWD